MEVNRKIKSKEMAFLLMTAVNWLGNASLVFYVSSFQSSVIVGKQFYIYVVLEILCVQNLLLYVFSKKMMFRGGGLPAEKKYNLLRGAFAAVCMFLVIVSFRKMLN